MKALRILFWVTALVCGVLLAWSGFLAIELASTTPPGGFHSQAGQIP